MNNSKDSLTKSWQGHARSIENSQKLLDVKGNCLKHNRLKREVKWKEGEGFPPETSWHKPKPPYTEWFFLRNWARLLTLAYSDHNLYLMFHEALVLLDVFLIHTTHIASGEGFLDLISLLSSSPNTPKFKIYMIFSWV